MGAGSTTSSSVSNLSIPILLVTVVRGTNPRWFLTPADDRPAALQILFWDKEEEEEE